MGGAKAPPILNNKNERQREIEKEVGSKFRKTEKILQLVEDSTGEIG